MIMAVDVIGHSINNGDVSRAGDRQDNSTVLLLVGRAKPNDVIGITALEMMLMTVIERPSVNNGGGRRGRIGSTR